uniref:Testis expressed 2 n=1 Tax=Myotis myotis TaxID=51298 RepID=A0A7J7T9P1_MYOMY|nr:testis expressed 2 [Myotis myotis]
MTSLNGRHAEKAIDMPKPSAPRVHVQRSVSRDTIAIHFSASGEEEEEEEEEFREYFEEGLDDQSIVTGLEAKEDLYFEPRGGHDPTGPASQPILADGLSESPAVLPVSENTVKLLEAPLPAVQVLSTVPLALSPGSSSSGPLASSPSVSSLSEQKTSSSSPLSSPSKSPVLSSSASSSTLSSSKPFMSLVKSLSTEVEPKEPPPPPRHRHLMKTLVKSLSTDTSKQESDTVSYKPPDSKLNLHLFKQFTQPRNTGGDSKTAPSSPLTSPSDTRSFFKVPEMEAKIEDTKRRLSEVIHEPFQLLSKIIGEESGSHRPKALSSSASELSNLSSLNGHLESNHNYSIKEEECDSEGDGEGSNPSIPRSDHPKSIDEPPKEVELKSSQGWMNEIYNYDPETYHATLTHSVFVRLEGGTLRLSKPNKNISRRASYNETKPEVTYISQKIYDLSDSKIYLVPKSLARKRIWNKKYPICIELGRQDDFMSKAQTDKETSEEKPPAERDLGVEDPKKPPHPQEGTRSGQRDQILYLFGRTGREKEEWFRRFILASKLKSEIKKPTGVSGSKSGILPSHSRHSSPSGHLTHSRSSSKGSVEEIMSQPKQKELMGSVRQKMLLDYSVYMARCVPQENRSPQRSPVQSAESSPTAGKKLPEAPPSEEEEQEAWVNALLGRMFWDFLGEKYWSELVSKKIQMKLSKIKLPYFMNELTLTELDMGVAVPKILQAFKPYVDHQGLWIDLEMSYNGSFLMTLETKMNLTKLGKEPLVEALKVGEIGKEGCRPRAYCLADSDEESSSAGSSEEDDAPEPSVGDKPLLPGAEGYVGGHRTSKIMRFVDKITKSKYFQKATETEFIKKKIEEVSNTPLLLTVEVQECRGTLAVNIPPPPSDRIWYGFRKPPYVELKARPKLGEREVTLVHVTDWIEKKLEQEFQKVFVMPNMDDVYIPIMHSAMDPRSTSCLLKDTLVEAADQL